MPNNTYLSSFVALQDVDAEADMAISSESVDTPDGTDA